MKMKALTSYLQESLKKINALDNFYATFLMAFTREYPVLEKRREQNKYADNASFEKPININTKYISINNTNIRYAHHENPGKETLVLLSPLPQSIIAYAPIWEKLTEKYEVYAYDLPGFGRSEGGLEYMTFKAQGEFLKLFLETLNIKKPHLIGPDIGMPSVLYYVGTFENDVKSIMIGDGPAIDPSNNGSIIEKLGFSTFWQFLIGTFVGSGAFVEVGNRIGYTNYTPNKYELSDYKKSYAGRLGNAIEWFDKYPQSLATVNVLLDTIETPTQIFWGEHDEILPKDNGERLFQRMKNSSLTILKDCGHFSYQDQHEEFSDLVIKWVENGYKQF